MVALNDIFLSVDKALNEEIVLNGGQKLFIDGTWNPEQHATVEGTVSAIPPTHKNPVLKQLKAGDKVAFSYAVCSEQAFADDSVNFVEATEGSDYCKVWYNGKGEKISVMAIPGKISLTWVGTYNDKNGELVDGRTGNEKEIERFMAQFSFGDSSELKFKNLIEAKGKDYWKCRYDDLFAVKKGKDIVALGDWILCEPMKIDKTTAYNLENGVSLPPMSIAFRLTDRAKVVSGGGFKKGTVIAGEERFWAQYRIWGKDYMIIRGRRVIGTYE